EATQPPAPSELPPPGNNYRLAGKPKPPTAPRPRKLPTAGKNYRLAGKPSRPQPAPSEMTNRRQAKAGF
ncbi:MAG: hypothetical protein KF760_16980, partial [Candidatus Eremiobacteraeota bacterium]|nr:hypothetical protein [Candidatus Eremiobacteraeota bacterium]